MSGAYIKKMASDQSRWRAELLVQTGKDDEIFGFSATAPNIAGSEWLRHLGLANVLIRLLSEADVLLLGMLGMVIFTGMVCMVWWFGGKKGAW